MPPLRTLVRKAVVMYPDAGGMRDTLRQMGERLSGLGYVVLVPDFYYRNGPYEPVDMRTAFENKESMEKIMGMILKGEGRAA